MKTWEVWTEGFCDQGMEGVPQKAMKLGKAKAETFIDACKIVLEKLEPYYWRCWWYIDKDGNPHWYTRLHDNEKDARNTIFG